MSDHQECGGCIPRHSHPLEAEPPRVMATATRLKPVDDVLEVFQVLADKLFLHVLGLSVEPAFRNLPMQLSDLHGLYEASRLAWHMLQRVDLYAGCFVCYAGQFLNRRN
jgi:hypothetical protein